MSTKFFQLSTALLFLMLIVLQGCKSNHDANRAELPQLPSAKVQVTEVKEVKVADQIEVLGTVQAAKNAIIASKISGNISSIAVVPGSPVKHGDTLITINAGEISAKVVQAKAQLDQAKRNLSREEKLLAQKATNAEAVKSMRDSLKIASAAYDEALSMMSYTTITAPFDGVITRKLVNTGDLATPGKPLVHIESEDTLQVVADVPESIALRIQLGMTMEIKVPTAGITTTGIIAEIAPVADTSTRSVPIKLDINNNPSLRSGQFARVNFPGSEVDTILIPPKSIYPFGQLERVFVAKDGKALLRLIRTGKTYSTGIEVLSGLTAGDSLIVAADTQLTDEQPIKIQ